jgi:hypothetical protein
MDHVIRNKSGIILDSQLIVILLDTGKIKTYFSFHEYVNVNKE